MNVFNYDVSTRKLEINEPELLLVREFAELLKRDKSKMKNKAWKELTYIYLAIDWRSVYANYSETERHEEALSDSGLTELEFNDPIFRLACRKYQSLQNSNKSIQLLGAAKMAADKLVDYFNVIVDFNERDENGKPIFKAKDVIAEMSSISKVHEELKAIEDVIKKDLQAPSNIRAGAKADFDPGEF